MKKLLPSILLMATVSLTFAQQQTQTKISDDLHYTQVKDSVYMIIHCFPGCGNNSLFVLLPNNKGVLIDTPSENTGMTSLLAWIQESFGTLELTAIITGFHQDNLGGNELLLARGVDVYGPELTKKLVLEEGDSLIKLMMSWEKDNPDKRYYESYSQLKLTPPNKTFPIEEGLQLTIEGETFEVYFPGESHTIDNTVVYLSKDKILFGGCMFKGLSFQNPGYMGYANMEEWPKSVEKVIAKYPDCVTVVPGHGDLGGQEVLHHTLKIVNNWNARNKGE